MSAKKLTILLVLMLGITLQLSAQDKKKTKETVTFLVSMSCGNCQKKIEKNIAFEKGVQDLEVDLENKTVKIEYNTKKTDVDKLQKAIEKLGFTVSLYEPKEEKETSMKSAKE